jgi:hypothetical protein
MAVTFHTTLMKDNEKNATGIVVPAEVVAALSSSKRPKVVVSLNGYTYRTTMGGYGETFMLPVSQERRAEAGLEPGQSVEVTLELDTEPRIVDVPEDLAAALAAKPGARAAFDALAQSKRKEAVRQVEEAKAPETRARRIAGIVDKL